MDKQPDVVNMTVTDIIKHPMFNSSFRLQLCEWMLSWFISDDRHEIFQKKIEKDELIILLYAKL